MARTTVDSGQMRDDSIVNADVSATAAIAGTKISPNFGAQNLIVDTNVLFVDTSTDRVGIGTASPTRLLDLNHATAPEIGFMVAGTSVGSIFSDGSNFYIDPAAGDGIRLRTNGGFNRLTILSSGEVGIATTTPVAKLDVFSDVAAPTIIQYWGNSATGFAGYASFDYTGSSVFEIGQVGSGAAMSIQQGTGGLVINESGASADFRVEGDTDANLIFADASTDRVGIGTASPASRLHASAGASGVTPIAATVIAAESSGDAAISILTPNTQTGVLYFSDPESASIGRVQYEHFANRMSFVTGGAEFMRATSSVVVFNELGVNQDFRVEGDIDANLLFVDASSDRVGIGTASPSSMFSVGATSQFQVGSDGDLDRIKDLAYSWPTSHGSSGDVLTNNGSGTLTWAAAGGSGGLSWTKYTVAETAFTAAATSESITLFSLAAGGVIHGVKIRHTASFTGGGLTAFTVEVGISGATNRYASAFDVFQAASDTTFQTSHGFFSENHGSTTTVQITARSVGANVSAATAGSVEVWVLTSTAT